MSRVTDRQGWEPHVRIQLLEGDADRFEARLEEWEERLVNAVKEQNDRIAANTKTLIGILVAIATSGVLLALNLVVVAGK
ncbi:MAG TPA: hypothetical protein VGE43_19490 [Acidimicrobiales bacterium]